MRWKTLAFVLCVICESTAFAEEREKSGIGCPRNSRAFSTIQARAEAGDPPAQAALASCYGLGCNVSTSRTETIRWLRLAADRGYGPAQYELGRIYGH